MIDHFEFFSFFLPAAVFVFDRLDARWRTRWLLIASLTFYAMASAKHLPFLVGSVAINYAIGRRLSAVAERRRLCLGNAANLLVLE